MHKNKYSILFSVLQPREVGLQAGDRGSNHRGPLKRPEARSQLRRVKDGNTIQHQEMIPTESITL